MPAEVINIYQDAASEQGYELSEEIQHDGYLSSGYIHFPPGCAGLVQVRVSVEVKGSYNAVAPVDDFERNRPQFIQLDDFTLPFPIDLDVKSGERIKVEINNYDKVEDHAITVLVYWWDHKPSIMAELSVLIAGIREAVGGL